jgi:6-phosphogluconolactonase
MGAAGMSDPGFKEFANREALDRALAHSVAQSLQSAVDARGEALLVVSGGSTPKGVFKLLSEQPIDWSCVQVTLADERWVPATHQDSNERLVRENLLVGQAAGARFVSLTSHVASPAEGLSEVEARINALPTFDVVLLGMGEDGHTASLFPESEALAHGLDLSLPSSCIAVTPPAAPHQRMSLTLRRLLDTRRLVLHITGDQKRKVYASACAARDPMMLPIAAVIDRVDPALEVFWSP